MTAEKDPRIEAVAKLLFTGPLWGYNTKTWDLAGDMPNNYDLAYERSRCLLAAERVVRGMNETEEAMSDDGTSARDELIELLESSGDDFNDDMSREKQADAILAWLAKRTDGGQ